MLSYKNIIYSKASSTLDPIANLSHIRTFMQDYQNFYYIYRLPLSPPSITGDHMDLPPVHLATTMFHLWLSPALPLVDLGKP